ncbi:MAG TPA: sialidase, partial [Cytophagales bacterium]|nr:sialidase [Cytophagales bacterium]
MHIHFKNLVCFAFLFIFCSTLLLGQVLKKEEIDQLKFRHIGPVGNRITCAVGIPGNDMIYLVGAASGGIWKTTDGGITWKPVFDDKPVASIGALAIASSDPQVVFAGTGESFIRSNVSIGNGVWKSTDGGESWQQVGLENTGRISRIIIHPTNPDIVYVCSVGHGYAPQKERGVYQTTDGGKTWKQILFVDENTGSSDLAMDPTNPRFLIAGMWQLSLRSWNRTSGGPGSGIYVSKDAGETWTKLKGNGLPEQPVGKIALAMTPADPNRIYALIETGDGVEKMGEKTENGELWRSDDKSKTWKMINSNRNLASRQAYYTRCTASPDRPNDVYFMTHMFSASIDGGKSTDPDAVAEPAGDNHDLWIDPQNGARMIVASDGGVSISKNRGKTWMKIILPVAQLYHVTTDNNIPYNVLVNEQDNPSMRGPSRSGFGSTIPTGLWFEVGGGESGFATPDPKDPDVVWSSASGTGAAGGVVVKYNVKNRQFRQVEIWPEYTPGHPAAEVKYRFQWTFPLLISPHDHNTVYATSQVVHRTINGGQSWSVISPDLTLNDKTKQQKSGGLTPDNIGVEYANVIYALEESPVKKGVLWVGTNDGQVQLSQDDGKTWENLTKNFIDLPPLGTVRNIDASKWNEGKAYLVVDLHDVGNFQPFVYKTENFGKTWKKIVKGIEPGNLNYCRSIKEDPIRKGLLYLGTETTLYI